MTSSKNQTPQKGWKCTEMNISNPTFIIQMQTLLFKYYCIHAPTIHLCIALEREYVIDIAF